MVEVQCRDRGALTLKCKNLHVVFLLSQNVLASWRPTTLDRRPGGSDVCVVGMYVSQLSYDLSGTAGHNSCGEIVVYSDLDTNQGESGLV